MKFISTAEYRKLTPIQGHYKKSNFRDLVRTMKTGQYLFVGKDEWKKLGYKNSPAGNAGSIVKESKGKVRLKTRLFAEGWVVERVIMPAR